MIIDLATVGNTAKRIDSVFRPDEIDLESEAVTLTGDVQLQGETERINQRVEVRGTVDADVLLSCTRCVEDIERRFHIPFRAVFVDPADEDAAAEREIGSDELDVSPVEGGQIELAEVVREQILLAIPEQVFCRKYCKGLCPKCGENLNLIDCNCADDDIDPRWAALKSLK